MPDPKPRYENRHKPVEGAGPFLFDVGTLAAGETFRLNLRGHEENGIRGYYVAISEAGYDVLEVENPSGERLTVTINETADYPVSPNNTKEVTMEGIYDVHLENIGANAADDLRLSVLQTGHGADEAAREAKREPPIRGVIRKFTGI